VGKVGNCSKVDINHYQPLLSNFGFGPVVQGYGLAFWSAVRPFSKRLFVKNTPYRLNTNTHVAYLEDWNHLKGVYADLDDAKKAAAHYFGSGKTKDTPQSKWSFVLHFQIVLDIARNEFRLDYKKTTKLLFVYLHSFLDATIVETFNKRYWDYPRPTTVMQCLNENAVIASWGGPYEGVKLINGSDWKAWFVPGLVNNPGPEYPCGHCIAFAAISTAMELFFDSSEFKGNNVTILKGSSLVEPKITFGNPGYIAGVTDVANAGKNTVGYAFSHDISLGWKTWKDLSLSCSNSRIYLGAHTLHSTVVGRELGEKVAENVYDIANTLFSSKKHAQCKKIGSDE